MSFLGKRAALRLKSFLSFNLAALPEGSQTFWSGMCCLALCACLAGEYFIEAVAYEQDRQMIQNMQSRAESLIWALEAGARFFTRKENEPLQELLTEMGRQPGIAWIAITDARGRILYDSDSQPGGTILYTAREVARLKPGSELQGRFAPDDAGIYETWKLFRPERLAKGRKNAAIREAGPFYIFAALNASAFQEDLNEYLEKLRLLATLLCASGLCFLTLLFYMRKFRLSRRKLAASEALASGIIDNYPGALLLTDMEGKIILANGKAREYLNMSEDDDNLLDLANYDWQACLQELEEADHLLEKELALPGADASPKAISLTASLIAGESGKRALLILQDLSEIRQLRKKLSQSRRLSAIGKMASGIAHEIRNPLSSIRGYAHYLQARLEGDPMGRATAALLVDETRRINDSLTDLLSLSRPPQLKLARNSLLDIVRKATVLLRPDADSKGIALKLDAQGEEGEDPPLTDADRLLQALLNLLINALQFTPEGGRVELRLRHREAPSPGWLISIQDNGPGIAENALTQIFNPYFSTREEGTGLGLSIARQIVESHGGEISVASAPGKGAIFTIFLPAAPESMEQSR